MLRRIPIRQGHDSLLHVLLLLLLSALLAHRPCVPRISATALAKLPSNVTACFQWIFKSLANPSSCIQLIWKQGKTRIGSCCVSSRLHGTCNSNSQIHFFLHSQCSSSFCINGNQEPSYMYLMCTLTHASNLVTARLQLETLSRESLSTCINLVKSQAHVLNSSH